MSYFDPKDGSENFFKDFSDWLKIKDNDENAVVSLFDKISAGYSTHMDQKVLPVFQKLIGFLLEQIEIDQHLDKNCSILDVACGTGIVGQCLRKAGFTGNIEGVDGSQGMINEAAKLKNVYNKLYTEFLKPDGRTFLPKQNYDVVVVGHAFFPNYLDADHLEMLFEFLRVGGLLLFNIKYDIVEGPDEMMKYVAKLNKKLDELAKSGKCKCILVCDVDGVSPRLKYTNPVQGKQTNIEFIHERQYCYKKI